MKILIIPTWYPSGEDKLMGNYHKEYTQALNQYGLEANMIYVDRQRISKPLKYLFMKHKQINKECNYKVYIYKMLNWASISFDLQQKIYCKKLEKAFLEYIKENGRPDIIHAHVTIPAGYAACKIGMKYNIPVVVTEHFSKYERFFSNVSFSKYGNFVLENSIFSTVSKYMKNTMLGYTKECYVLPNLVDTTLFNNKINRKLNGTFNLVSVCALREGKKIENIFKAINLLIKKGNNKIHLDVIGDGFLESYYRQECEKLNLGKYVVFHGRKSKAEISEILKKEHALVISSELESFAIPGIEALASGLPVISTKCLGPEEYIDDKCGVLCEKDDIESLASAIEFVQTNYDKYDPKYLRSVADKFSQKEVVKIAKDIYEKAIEKYNGI